MAALKISDLEKLEPLTVIMDKYATRYFKTADGVWMSNSLERVDPKTIVKNRLVIDKSAIRAN